MRSICGRRWLPCTPATSADRARSEQFFTRPDAQESDRFPRFISMRVRVIATGQTQREAPCTFHDSDLKNPSANVSLASAVLFTFVSPAVRPDAPKKRQRRSPLRWHQCIFRASLSPKVFSCRCFAGVCAGFVQTQCHSMGLNCSSAANNTVPVKIHCADAGSSSLP